MTNNTVQLLGYYGSDTIIACSAWTSTSRELSEEKKQRIPKLIKDLWSNGHETPFEKSALHFLVTCDQASHIHLLKHRIGVSINGESARYKELKEDKFYIPEDWNDITSDEAYVNTTDDEGNLKAITHWTGILTQANEAMNDFYHQCLEDLTPILGRKRAKESARFFKLMNSQITMDVMFNWRSFYHFQMLRNHHDAQLEIQEIAQQMLVLVRHIEGNPFKHTIEAFKL
jgi:flavin-dependent thymidylate synthase